MAEELTAWFAQAFVINAIASTVKATVVTNGGGGVEADVSPSAVDRYHRIYLAQTIAAGADGTAAKPYNFLEWLESKINTAAGGSYWTVRLQSSGLVRITAVGGGGFTNGSVTWTYAGLARLLGNPPDTGTLTAGQYVEGTHLPSHVIAAISWQDDSDWTPEPARAALARMSNGRVYGYGERRPQASRTGTIRLLPRDETYRTASGPQGTPAVPPAEISLGTDYPWTDPYDNEPFQGAKSSGTYQWTVWQQMGIQVDQRWGCCWGDLQALVAGTSNEFDVCGVDPESLRSWTTRHPIANYEARTDIVGLKFSRIDRHTRT